MLGFTIPTAMLAIADEVIEKRELPLGEHHGLSRALPPILNGRCSGFVRLVK